MARRRKVAAPVEQAQESAPVQQVVPRRPVRPDYRCTRCQTAGAVVKTTRRGVAYLECPARCTDEDGSVWFKLPVG